MARGWRIAHRHGNKMVLARILLAILCAGVLAPSNGRALDIQQVQGRGHVSPLLGQDV
jgi:hypothetical protein